jgi:hypothetical protein
MVLEPGLTYRLSSPAVLAVGAGFNEVFAQTTGVIATWLTSTEYTDRLASRRYLGQPVGTPGTGSVLSLIADPAAAAVAKTVGDAMPEADPYSGNNRVVIRLTLFARNASNFSAIATAVVAAANGGPARLRVGIKNHGPSTAAVRSGYANGVYVRVPDAVRVTLAPSTCLYVAEIPPTPEDPYGLAPYYWCHTGPVLPAGQTAWFEFPGVFTGASWPGASVGGVNINAPAFGSGGERDTNPADDAMPFTFQTTATQGQTGR